MTFSILIATFLFAFFQVNAGDQCDNNNSTQCLCTHANYYDYQCPPSDTKLLILSVPEAEYLQIDCINMETLDVHLFPNYTCGNTGSILINACPLPEDNFLSLIDKFNIKNVEKLHLDNVYLSENSSSDAVSKNIFFGFNNLKILTLSHMTNLLDDDLLVYLPKLSQFDLDISEIAHLNNFKLPSSIKVSHITRNLLTEVPQGIFQNVTQLTLLQLWGNQITSIKKSDFRGLRNLRYLELSSNKISSIEEDSFSELRDLKNISLGANKMGKINSTLFKNNKNLISIRLENNPNLNLPDQIFANLEKLTNIDLKNTSTKDIPHTLFKNLKKLTTLDLSSNQISSLPDDVFSDLISLQTLTLDNNNITYISKDLLKNTKELIELNVKNNKIFDIHIEAFLSLTNLITLDLSNNVYQANHTSDTSPFSHCTALEIIYLTHNSITRFPNSLLSLQSIEDIYLNFNKICTIQIFNIISVLSPNLKFISVSNNEIRDVIFEDIQSQTDLDSYRVEGDTILLDLKNNPFICDCKNYDFIRYIQNNMTYMTTDDGRSRVIIDVEQTKCSNPKIYRGRNIADLMPKDVVCQNSTIPCPEECECFWRPNTDFIEVNCTNLNLTQFPQLQISNKQILINLDGNYIRGGLEPGLGYENVKILILSNNHLQELKWIPLGIKVLNLDRNKLTHISPELFQVLNNTVDLTTIQLSNNPWDCGCSALALQIFIRDNNPIKINPKDVVCKEDHMLLIEKTDLCRMSTALILFIVLPVLSFLLLTVVGLILYIYYRQEVKVWLFSKNLCLWCVTEEEIDEDKLYDIFISYSNKDEEFVTQNLLPVLESGPRPFTTCIHVRDWEPGEMILTHVANSVINSRRTLVVLSNNFLDSVWGIQEFKTAHTQAVKEGRARVIVVKYGELDDSRLDEDIKAYLNTNTYVEWGKPWFWYKLKYALPHSHYRRSKTNQKHANIMLKINEKFQLHELPINHLEDTPSNILNSRSETDQLVNFPNDLQISSSDTPLINMEN